VALQIEQVNKALAQGQTGEHWVKGLRYIPSFYNQPAYIDLMARFSGGKKSLLR
jgi:ferrochelatase